MSAQRLQIEFKTNPFRSFDLCRLEDAEDEVHISIPMIRKLHSEEGLKFYRCRKMVFFSYSELENLIREQTVKHSLTGELKAELERA